MDLLLIIGLIVFGAVLVGQYLGSTYSYPLAMFIGLQERWNKDLKFKISLLRGFEAKYFLIDPSFKKHVRQCSDQIDRLEEFIEQYQSSGDKIKTDPFSNTYDFQIRLIVFKSDMKFEILSSGITRSTLKITFPETITARMEFKVSKRGTLSRIFGINKGEYYHLTEDYNIQCSNIMFVKFLFNDEKNHPELHDIWELDDRNRRIDINNILTLEIPNSPNLTIKICFEYVQLVNVFHNFLGSVKGKEFTVQEIVRDINVEELELICIICYQDLVIDTALLLSCCSSMGHSEHIKEWLEASNSCPYCYDTEFKLLRV